MRRAKVSPIYRGKRKKMKREDAIADAKMARMRARTRSATRNLSPQYSSSSSSSTAAPPPPPPPPPPSPPAEEPAEQKPAVVDNNKEVFVIDTAGSDEAEEEAWKALDVGGGEPWDLKAATSFNNWEWEDSLLQLTYEEEWSLFGGMGGGGGYFSNNSNNNGGLFEEDWNLWNFNCTTTTPAHPAAASDRKPTPP